MDFSPTQKSSQAASVALESKREPVQHSELKKSEYPSPKLIVTNKNTQEIFAKKPLLVKTLVPLRITESASNKVPIFKKIVVLKKHNFQKSPKSPRNTAVAYKGFQLKKIVKLVSIQNLITLLPPRSTQSLTVNRNVSEPLKKVVQDKPNPRNSSKLISMLPLEGTAVTRNVFQPKEIVVQKNLKSQNSPKISLLQGTDSVVTRKEAEPNEELAQEKYTSENSSKFITLRPLKSTDSLTVTRKQAEPKEKLGQEKYKSESSSKLITLLPLKSTKSVTVTRKKAEPKEKLAQEKYKSEISSKLLSQIPLKSTDSVTVTRNVFQPKQVVAQQKLKSQNSLKLTTPLPLKSIQSVTVTRKKSQPIQKTVQEKSKSPISPKCVLRSESYVNNAEKDSSKFLPIFNEIIKRKQVDKTKQRDATQSTVKLKYVIEGLGDKPKDITEPVMKSAADPWDKFLSFFNEIENRRVVRQKKDKKTEASGPFFCDLCPEKQFTSIRKLRPHIYVTHLGLETCVCSVCGKCLKTIGSLNRHKMLHTGEKSFACKTCGKTFLLKGHLSVHQRAVHEKEKRFCCYVCGFRVFGSSTLKEHLRRHNQERTSFCHLCPKAFYTNSELKTHMRTHDKLQPRGPK